MKTQIERAEPSRGAPSWSKMMAEMQTCGHTNAQHLYHDSGDIKIDLSACLVHTSIEHAGQTSGGTTADVAKAASAAPEPSRGAPEAALQALRQWEADTEAPARANEGNAFIDGFQAGRAGHVVLLEALWQIDECVNDSTVAWEARLYQIKRYTRKALGEK